MVEGKKGKHGKRGKSEIIWRRGNWKNRKKWKKVNK